MLQIKAEPMISTFDRTENIMEKGENAGDQHFLLFHNVYKNISLFKVESVWVWIRLAWVTGIYSVLFPQCLKKIILQGRECVANGYISQEK